MVKFWGVSDVYKLQFRELRGHVNTKVNASKLACNRVQDCDTSTGSGATRATELLGDEELIDRSFSIHYKPCFC